MKSIKAIELKDKDILTRVTAAVRADIGLKKSLNRPYTYFDAKDKKIYQVVGNKKTVIKDMNKRSGYGASRGKSESSLQSECCHY